MRSRLEVHAGDRAEVVSPTMFVICYATPLTLIFALVSD